MRLFVAFLLDDAVRRELARVSASLARKCDGVRWTPAEQLHVTVKFLGEVPDGDVPGIGEAMDGGSRRIRPFDVGIGGSGCFPPRGAARIVWVGLTDGAAAMTAAVTGISTELERIGFAPEARAWSPHITIGRVKDDSSNGRLRAAVEACTFAPLRQRIDSVRLMQSVLSPRGAVYSVVSTAALGG